MCVCVSACEREIESVCMYVCVCARRRGLFIFIYIDENFCIFIYIHIHEGKLKSSSLAYNRRETWDKRSLDRNLDRSWCHRHTSVKLSWSQPMDPWSERQNTRMQPLMSMEPWAATKKALH